jgi:hypothetical protein
MPIVLWEDKKIIIEWLYNKFNINKFRYTIIKEESHLDFLAKNEHYILLNYASINYLLLFLFVGTKKMCVLIDRKSLIYQPKNYDDVIRSVIMYSLELKFQVKGDLYKGTLFDVKMINNTFYVYNLFLWKGEDKTNESSLENFRLIDHENIDFVNQCKVYYYSDLLVLKDIIDNDNKVKGLIFIPKIPGNMMIFLSNGPISQKVNNNVVTNHYNVKKIELDNTNVFKMNITDLPDVYQLYNENTKKTTIAYIPNIKTSEIVKSWYKSSNKRNLTVKCEYRENLDKYIPTELIESN